MFFFLISLGFLTGYAHGMCEPVKAPLCSNMPYNLTSMPNSFHHATQENAILAVEQYQALVNTGCSKVLSFFLCTMYFPVCAAIDQVLKPCRSICMEAKEGCLPIMMRYNVSWPDSLSCEELPEYDQGLCVTPLTIIQDPTSKPPPGVVIPQVETTVKTESRKTESESRPNVGRRRNRDRKQRKGKQERRQERLEKKQKRQQKKRERLAKKQEKKEERKRQRVEARKQAKKEERKNRRKEERKRVKKQDKKQRRRRRKKSEVTVMPTEVTTELVSVSGTDPNEVKPTPCVCQPPRLVKKQLKSDQFSCKMKASWSGLERSPNGSTLMKFKLLDVFSWHNEAYPEDGSLVVLQTNNTCICPRFKEGRVYLVAGSNEGSTLKYEVALKWKPILKKWVGKQKRRKPVRRRKMKERRRTDTKEKDERKKRQRNGRRGDAKKQKMEEKRRKKEERKQRKKERRRQKFRTTMNPLLEWTTTVPSPVDEGASV